MQDIDLPILVWCKCKVTQSFWRTIDNIINSLKYLLLPGYFHFPEIYSMEVTRDVNKDFCTRILIIALFIKAKAENKKEITNVK